MKTKLVDFDIEKARNGAIAFACNLDHSGARHCRIICFDLMGEFPIAAAVRYKYADSWDDNCWNECSHGIHFFIDRQSAVNY